MHTNPSVEMSAQGRRFLTFIENITERGLVKEIVFSLTAQLLNACFKTKCLAVEKQAAIAVVFFVARMSPD